MTTIISNTAGAIKAETPLFKDMFDVMDRLEYRRAVNEEDLEPIGVLRQKALDSREVYEDKIGKPIVEDLDRDPSSYVFGLYYQQELISTVRIRHVTAKSRNSPIMNLYGNVLNPLLDQGVRFIDPSRFAVNEVFSKAMPGLPLLTLRLAVIATVHFQADHCLSAVNRHHRAFYLRVFRSTQLAGPLVLPGIAEESVLLAASLLNQADIFRRYPIFNFLETESRLLFGDLKDRSAPLCVRPTARIALKEASKAA